jgi:hypothetical protein
MEDVANIPHSKSEEGPHEVFMMSLANIVHVSIDSLVEDTINPTISKKIKSEI